SSEGSPPRSAPGSAWSICTGSSGTPRRSTPVAPPTWSSSAPRWPTWPTRCCSDARDHRPLRRLRRGHHRGRGLQARRGPPRGRHRGVRLPLLRRLRRGGRPVTPVERVLAFLDAKATMGDNVDPTIIHSVVVGPDAIRYEL